MRLPDGSSYTPKAPARSLYAQLSGEMLAQPTKRDFVDWMHANKGRVEKLPWDWIKNFRETCEMQMKLHNLCAQMDAEYKAIIG